MQCRFPAVPEPRWKKSEISSEFLIFSLSPPSHCWELLSQPIAAARQGSQEPRELGMGYKGMRLYQHEKEKMV